MNKKLTNGSGAGCSHAGYRADCAQCSHPQPTDSWKNYSCDCEQPCSHTADSWETRWEKLHVNYQDGYYIDGEFFHSEKFYQIKYFIAAELASAERRVIEELRGKVEKLVMLDDGTAQWAKKEILEWCFPPKNQRAL